MQIINKLGDNIRESAVGRWYEGRDPQERPIILGVALLVVVALGWVAVWNPIYEWRDNQQSRYARAQTLVDWMQANEKAARVAASTSPKPGANSNRALIPVITRSANAHGLKLNRLQPEQNGMVSVVLESQPFNKVITWVSQLQENNGVTVQTASFDPEEEPGYISANLRLK